MNLNEKQVSQIVNDVLRKVSVQPSIPITIPKHEKDFRPFVSIRFPKGITMKNKTQPRRKFLKSAAGVAAAVSLPTWPASRPVHAAPLAVSKNDRLSLGLVNKKVMALLCLRLVSVGLVPAAFVRTAEVQAAENQPNVIVIYTDDHGYADLSCQKVFGDIRAPNIDALATGGVRMTDGYCTAPQCVPSRGGLISGQYQTKWGLESNPQFRDPATLKRFDELETIPEHLSRQAMSPEWRGSGVNGCGLR